MCYVDIIGVAASPTMEKCTCNSFYFNVHINLKTIEGNFNVLWKNTSRLKFFLFSVFSH